MEIIVNRRRRWKIKPLTNLSLNWNSRYWAHGFCVCFFFYFSDEFILKGVFDFNMPLFWYWNEKNMKILKSFFYCKVKYVLHLLLKSNLINFQFQIHFSSKWQVSVTFSLDLIHFFHVLNFHFLTYFSPIFYFPIF